MEAAELVDRYLSDDEKREIAREAWRDMCREHFTSVSATSAIADVAYSIVKEIVAETIGGDCDKLITEKAVAVINDLSSFTVFRQPDRWDAKPSPAWSLLMDTVMANRDAVAERVRHHIHNLSKREALEVIKGAKLTIQANG
ncbi:hypothetical protein [Sagittula sp. S175]|uniref:hypothetical protein n=1 Tax=Sagittula sp. S175 TaxID=3415129 RepID=UPI003C7C2F4D